MFYLIIYSCYKNIHIAERLYENTVQKIPNHCVLFICYGKELLDSDYLIQGHHFVLNSSDLYDDLDCKTICLIKSLLQYDPLAEGLLKIDDDIVLNYFKLYEFLQSEQLKQNDYLGKQCVFLNRTTSTHHFSKVSSNSYYSNRPVVIPKCSYAGGPIYFLGKRALNLFKTDITCFMNEDVTVGYHLNQYDIYPVEYPLYTDHVLHLANHVGWHNISKTYSSFLIMRLQGGLGNQLFQLASLFGISKRMNRIAAFSDHLLQQHPNHHSYKIYTSSLFNKMLGFQIVDEKNCHRHVIYQESHHDCLRRIDNLPNPHSQALILNGYFQNEGYFQDYRSDILEMFLSSIRCETDSYNLLHESFFIHFRLGDYVNHPFHYIDLKNYYQKCIEAITSIQPNVHLYVFSNDVQQCKKSYTYLLQNLRHTFVEEDEVKSLYIMSLCNKGGVCANSTYSWWAGYLNTNPNKKIYFPNKWFPHSDNTGSIGFKGAILIPVI